MRRVPPPSALVSDATIAPVAPPVSLDYRVVVVGRRPGRPEPLDGVPWDYVWAVVPLPPDEQSG